MENNKIVRKERIAKEMRKRKETKSEKKILLKKHENFISIQNC